MDSETDTDTISFSEDSRENYKSPESSDCEGYATPLASSLTDIPQSLTIDVPEDTMDSGERTPVSTQAISPPVVKQIIYLQKPKILVMTQREIVDESSEEEFYDVDDVQIRDVAQQLLNGVDDVIDERPDTPIVEEESETHMETEDMLTEEEEERMTPILVKEISDSEALNDTDQGPENQEDVLQDSENQEADQEEHEEPQGNQQKTLEDPEFLDELEIEIEMESEEEQNQFLEVLTSDVDQEDVMDVLEPIEASAIVLEMEPELLSATEVEADISEIVEAAADPASTKVDSVRSALKVEAVLLPPVKVAADIPEKVNLSSDVPELVTDQKESPELPIHTKLPEHHEAEIPKTDNAPIVHTSFETCDNSNSETANNVITTSAECIHNSQTVPEKQVEVLVEKFEELAKGVRDSLGQAENVKKCFQALVLTDMEILKSVDNLEVQQTVQAPEVEDVENVVQEIQEPSSPVSLVPDRPELCLEDMPDLFSEIVVAQTPTASEQPPTINQEIEAVVILNEVKTPSPSDDDVLPTHKLVKVDFDGYSSGREESLSSSTSSESFEFAEPVFTVLDEHKQALRNSIIERYPSNETDEDDLDSVDEYDDGLLAVQQISAEVEQLVAACNSFGRDEEQQMSAYLVGKKMAAEKKRKSAMDTAAVTSTNTWSSSCHHDQTVQTDNDSLILVDRHLPEVMESLQVEIDKLQADLDKVKNGEKELLKINAKLKEDLEESQQTIDGIEVEAEQQYTELTGEIDELCEIVQKKDQELAMLKERIANLSMNEANLRDDVDTQRMIGQRQKEIIESLREELDTITKKLSDVTKLRDKAIEEVTVLKMKNMERDRFLSREAQMSMEIEDLQRELNKQKLILNQTSMAKLADTFDRKVLHLENELRERDMLICKQNQIINSHRKSPTGSVMTSRKMQPRASVLAASGNSPSAGSSSESFQQGLDAESKEALFNFIMSNDRHNQLANIYNIGRILDLTPQEERTLERHLTKDRYVV
ncbi:hypothetical protein L5515_016615 [Caenorhabditis briggsae]|uniref:Uncharacterized protein n=1 Tax=Caenorhabditis briggsae TaxID=6238 RepID=A0AAE9FC39_CAEBR|nr:hypothetical protein L5515_016615 [Caenorhabditis briggsae]